VDDDMRLGAKWDIALLAIPVVAVLLVGGTLLLRDGLSGGLLRIEAVEEGHDVTDPLVLDEARTREEAPVLAALLDEASASGVASTSRERDIQQAMDYIHRISAEQRDAPGEQPLLLWQGRPYLYQHMVA
jgi:hypothetical protein